MTPFDKRDTLAQAHALEHSAMIMAQMDEQAMRRAIIGHNEYQAHIKELLEAAKKLREKHAEELRASMSDAAQDEGEKRG